MKCDSCERLAARDRGEAPEWDAIHRSEWFDVAHAYNTSLPGWLVLVVRRHVETVAELTDDEAVDLGLLIKNVSGALHATVGCVKTYIVQFAESRFHQHVHVHVIPRYADQARDERGPAIFARLGVDVGDCVPDETMNEIARGVRERLVDAENRGAGS